MPSVTVGIMSAISFGVPVINKKPNNRTDEMPRLRYDLPIKNRYDAHRAFNFALLVLFGVPIFLFVFVLTSADVLGQDKWMVTPSRGGAEGARAQAQLTTIQNESMRMNACTVTGRIYAPTHPNRDANDCIPHLTLNPTTGSATFTNGVTVNSGGVTVTGNSAFNNNLTVGGPTTVNNTLNVTGTSTFGNNMTVTGRVTTNQLFVGSGNVGSIPSCTSAQKLQWSGTAWSCVTDNIGATAATEIDPKVGTLINGRWCRTNGSQVICDQSPPSGGGAGAVRVVSASGSAWRWPGATASCDSSEQITGGGGVCTGGSGDWRMHRNRPHGNGWTIGCDTSYAQNGVAYVYAMCMKK